MSFYWENTDQQNPVPFAESAASHWDNINLASNTPLHQYSQQPYYGQDPQHHAHHQQNGSYGVGSYETYNNPYVSQNQSQTAHQSQQNVLPENASYEEQWKLYHAQQAEYLQQQQNQQAQQQIQHVTILPANDSAPRSVDVQPSDSYTREASEIEAAAGGSAPLGTSEVCAASNILSEHTFPPETYRDHSLTPGSTESEIMAEREERAMEFTDDHGRDPPVADAPLRSHLEMNDCKIAFESEETEHDPAHDNGQERNSEQVEGLDTAGWDEEWHGDSVVVGGDEEAQPRTSTPSPPSTLNHGESGLLMAAVSDVLAASPIVPSHVILTNEKTSAVHPLSFAPPPPIVLSPHEKAHPSALSVSSEVSSMVTVVEAPTVQTSPSGEEGAVKTPTPTASMDSWVEVSSSTSDALGGKGTRGHSSSNASTLGTRVLSNQLMCNGIEDKRSDAPPDSDSTQDSRKEGNVRDRYKDIKRQYPALLSRLNEYRISGREHNKTPNGGRLGNPLFEAGRPASIRVAPVSAKVSTPKDSGTADSTHPPAFRADISAINNTTMYSELDTTVDSLRGFGEDIVDGLRKGRNRANRSRPSSRARSELGESLLRDSRERMPSDRRTVGGERYRSSQYEQPSYHSQYGYYPSGRHSTVNYGGMNYYGQQNYSRRPQSTHDSSAYHRYERNGRRADYDAYEYVSSEQESEEEEEGAARNESEEEMREISQAAALSRSLMSQGGGGGVRMGGYGVGANTQHESLEYYCGIVRLDKKRVNEIMMRSPPPPEFYTHLDNIEKVAYLFRTSLFGSNHSKVNVFKNNFRKEFYKCMCEPGCNEDRALELVCNDIRKAWTAKMAKRYEMTQRQLFSDDRETPESRLSDRASVYDHLQASDVDDASAIPEPCEPYLHRLPHAFATFGPGGKIIQILPAKSVSSVLMSDMHQTLQRDKETARAVDLAQHFKGPLLPGQTPPHIVRAYIQRQMERIRRSDLAQNDPRNEDIVDTLLVWQLLEMIVQQHGKVMGPDIARLLVSVAGVKRENRSLEMSIATPTPDPKAFEKFTHFLLDGLVDDAIDFALRQSMYMDALCVARRLAPHRVDEVEERHLGTRPQTHPFLTLIAVANGNQAPCLTNIPENDRGCWRLHAALLFANLSQHSHAMENIRRLGEVLARRELDAAADFCFLSVAILECPGVERMDTFNPPPAEMVAGVAVGGRRHIDLIHASIPDDANESTTCKFGFSLTDLHATEIFDYGSRLRDGGGTALAIAAPFHRRRLQYAQLLAAWGGFSLDAFRYCTEIARSMWANLHLFTPNEIFQLVDLADRLQKVSNADESQVAWIDALRQAIPTLQLAAVVPAVRETSVVEAKQERRHENTESLTAKAAAWHGEHQAPLEMTAPTASRGEDDRRDSVISHHSLHASPPRNTTSDRTTEVSRVSSDYDTPLSRSNEEYTSSMTGGMSEEGSPLRETRPLPEEEDFHVGTVMNHVPSPPLPNPLAPSHPSLPSHPVAPQPLPQPAAIPPSAPLPVNPQPLQPKPVQQQRQHEPQPPNSSGKEQDEKGRGKGSGGGGGGGIGSWFKNKVKSAIPSSAISGGTPEMKLPDDKKKTIYYDKDLGRYVGEGVEEEVAPPPPPSISNSLAAMGGEGSVPMGGGLRAARNSGGSRYFNPLNNASMGGTTSLPVAMPPPPTAPSAFGFIPSMPDDAVADSPFSETTHVPGEGEVQPVSAQ